MNVGQANISKSQWPSDPGVEKPTFTTSIKVTRATATAAAPTRSMWVLFCRAWTRSSRSTIGRKVMGSVADDTEIRNPNLEIRNNQQIQRGNGANQDAKVVAAASRFEFPSFPHSNLFRISDFGIGTLEPSNPSN